MDDGAIVAVVAIVFGFLYSVAKMIFRPSSKDYKENDATNESGNSHRELFDLAMRLQNRVETLERVLDNSAPEWRGKP